MTKRDSFIFYRSFYEALAELPDDERLRVYDAIGAYQFEDIFPDLMTGIPKTIFTLIRPQLDANNRRFLNGKKGGRPPKENQKKTKPKPKNNLNETKPEPNKNDNVNVNVNKNVNKRGQRLQPYLESIGIVCDKIDEIEWPDEWVDFAAKEFPDLPRKEIFTQLETMLDWSKTSKNGAKDDWMATWRNWIRRSAPDILLRLKREAIYGQKK